MIIKCLPKHDLIYDHEGAVSTTNWHLPSTRIKSCAATVAADFKPPPERSIRWRAEMRHSVVGVGELAQQVFR